MIEEIYILDGNSQKIIYGNPNVSLPTSQEPTVYVDSLRLLTKLKCDQVFLGALYTGFEPAHVLQFLKAISRHLPCNLDAKKVHGQYFAIFEFLSKYCVNDALLIGLESTQILPLDFLRRTEFSIPGFRKKNDVFLDIIEEFSAIADAEANVIKSEIYGRVFCRASLEKPMDIRVELDKAEGAKFLSNYEKKEEKGGLVFTASNYNSSILLTSYIKSDVIPPVSILRKSGGYDLKTRTVLEKIEILVPVPKTAYNVNLTAEKGSAKYTDGFVHWIIKDLDPSTINIKIGVSSLEKETPRSPIKVKFVGNSVLSGIRVRSANSETGKIDAYAKSKFQSGNYEIRISKFG